MGKISLSTLIVTPELSQKEFHILAKMIVYLWYDVLYQSHPILFNLNALEMFP